MSYKIGVLSDGSNLNRLRLPFYQLFTNLVQLDTALRTMALTELELTAIKAYTEIIHSENKHLVEIYCPWKNTSRRTYPFPEQYKTMNNEVYKQASSYVRGNLGSDWDRNNRHHRLYQANSILVLLGENYNVPLDMLLVHYNEHVNTQLFIKPIIKLAEHYEIPVLRLTDNDSLQLVYDLHPELIKYSK